MNQKVPVFYIINGSAKEMFACIDQTKEGVHLSLFDSVKSLWAKYSFDIKKIIVRKLADPLALDFMTAEKKFILKFPDVTICTNYFNKICTTSQVFKDIDALDNLDLQMAAEWPFQKGQLY